MTEKAHTTDLDSLRTADLDNFDSHQGRPYHDPENLKKLYHDLGWSQSQIADFYNVDQSTISRAMEEAGVNSRPPMDEREKSISRTVRSDGKVYYQVPDGEDNWFPFYRHQLVALLAEDGEGSWHVEDPFDLISEDSNELVVHHCMNFISLDIPANLEVMSQAEHVRGHAGGAIVRYPDEVLSHVSEGSGQEDGIHRPKSESTRRIRYWGSRFDANKNVGAD